MDTRPYRLARGAVFTLLILGAAAAANAQPGPAPAPTTANLQGNEGHAWMNNPHMRAFYDLTVATFAKGPDKVDLPSYQQKSYAIFRTFGASMGWKPELMQDHLKDIPRQMIGIVRDDPHALDSYKTFADAMIGPP